MLDSAGPTGLLRVRAQPPGWLGRVGLGWLVWALLSPTSRPPAGQPGLSWGSGAETETEQVLLRPSPKVDLGLKFLPGVVRPADQERPAVEKAVCCTQFLEEGARQLQWGHRRQQQAERGRETWERFYWALREGMGETG